MAFFKKCDEIFSDLQISKKKVIPKNYPELEFKFPANNSKVSLAGNLDFKLRIVFWNFFWRFGDLKKRIALSKKNEFHDFPIFYKIDNESFHHQILISHMKWKEFVFLGG